MCTDKKHETRWHEFFVLIYSGHASTVCVRGTTGRAIQWTGSFQIRFMDRTPSLCGMRADSSVLMTMNKEKPYEYCEKRIISRRGHDLFRL